MPTPDVRALVFVDSQRLLGAIDTEGDRLAAERRVAADALFEVRPGRVGAAEHERQRRFARRDREAAVRDLEPCAEGGPDQRRSRLRPSE